MGQIANKMAYELLLKIKDSIKNRTDKKETENNDTVKSSTNQNHEIDRRNQNF